MAALPRRLAMSRHLSFFHRRDAVFLYHDLWGYLLEMSADLVAFVRSFDGGDDGAHDGGNEGVIVAQALAASPFAFTEAHGFAEVLEAHAVLVAPGGDETLALADAYPIKARWRVAYHHPNGDVDVVQGRNLHAVRSCVRLTGRDARLWNAIDGARSCGALAALLLAHEQRDNPDAPATALDRDPADRHRQLLRIVCQRVAAWTHSDRQWLRVSTAPLSLWGGRLPPYLTSTMPYPALTAAGAHDSFGEAGADAANVVQTATYHADSIPDADAQFEDVETTLSHLFRDAHPALDQRTWAAALRDALVARQLWRSDTKDVVEIGGGLGWFALRMIEACDARARAELRYRVLDIAPTLQAAQRARLAHITEVSCLTCDAETLSLPDASVDLVISNEVIADLRTAWVDLADVDAARAPLTAATASESADNPGLEAVLRHELPVSDAPVRFAINLGAMRLIERLGAVLRPGGSAILTEFGHRFTYPIESTQLDHPEFSIQFSHLAHVAERCGLRAEIVSVPELVQLDGDTLALRSTQTWWANLRFLAASRGVILDKRAWTQPMLSAACGDALELERVEQLYWQPIGERTMGLVPDEFLALILRRPPVPAAAQTDPRLASE